MAQQFLALAIVGRLHQKTWEQRKTFHVAPTKSNLFREKSLQRLSSPERLDQLLQVINPIDWLILMALGLVVGAGLTWSIFGRISTVVIGRGVFIYPRTITPFQSSATGRILQLSVRNGSMVKKGQIIGLMDQPELQSRLQQQKIRLTALESLDTSARTLAQTSGGLAQNSLNIQRSELLQSIRFNQALVQRLKKQLDNIRSLKAQGLITDTVFIQAEQAYFDRLREINNLRTQLTDLDRKQQEFKELKFQQQVERTNRVSEAKEDLALTERSLAAATRIVSPYAGRVLSISTNVGKLVTVGETLGTIQRLDQGGKMVVLGYFIGGDGKRIKTKMKAQVSPDTTEQQRYGSILATINKTGEFPVTVNEVIAVVGKQELAQALIDQGRNIQIQALLTPSKDTISGYRWTTSEGPPLTISNGTTCKLLVTVEERAPITYVIPILRASTGIN